MSSLLTGILSSLLTSILSSLLTSIHCIRSSIPYFLSSCCSHFLPDYGKKFKTKVLKDSSGPEWNEQFVFDHLKLEDLCKNRVIELTVWNLTNNTKHYDFIGGLRLGPHPHHKKQLSYMDSSENELSHWMSVVNTPGECAEQLHTLRHNMDPLRMGVTLQQEVTVPHSLKTTIKTTPSDGLDSDNNRMVVCSSRQVVSCCLCIYMGTTSCSK